CLEITEKLCIVIGGGKVAERKVSGLLTAKALVRVISPQLTRLLRQWTEEKRIDWLNRGYQQGDLAGAMLVFAATDNRKIQKAVTREAQQAGQMVNIIDAPAECSFQVPAVVRRGDLTLAVSSNGCSPAVVAMVRKQLAEDYGEEYGLLLELVARIRKQVLAGDQGCDERKILFQNLLHEDIIIWIKTGQLDRLRKHLSAVVGFDVDFDV
ncbi:MAG: bifunctional precorrin-2 dehydrogenase/sirohydrochlorin ferrochelatase, partial [Desulfobulbaceae bacterium]|nr:bifunctional precorrin-2 dehydrogenase/sirohydrochlorin ferrochelatase [Desulfobulbaceae bacterium]